MVTYSRYDSLGDLDRRRRKAVKKALFEGEEFIMAIDCKEGRIRSNTNRKLVLTSGRVLSVRKGLIGSSTEDYTLDEITSIQYNTGLRSGKLRLQGAAIDDEFPTPKSLGQEFANAVREQKQQ